MSERDRQVEQLAAQVAEKVIKSGVQKSILDALLTNIQNNVQEAMLNALLIHASNTIQQRDREWAQALAALFTPSKEGLSLSPYEIERQIRAQQVADRQTVRKASYDAGFDEGFAEGVQKGTKMGWGGAQAGKSLNETLAGASKVLS